MREILNPPFQCHKVVVMFLNTAGINRPSRILIGYKPLYCLCRENGLKKKMYVSLTSIIFLSFFLLKTCIGKRKDLIALEGKIIQLAFLANKNTAFINLYTD